MKVLVFGRTGQVAREIIRNAPSGWNVTALGREDTDLADPAACMAAIAQSGADAVINAAAYTAVDKAETDEAYAMAINAVAPGSMAQASARLKIPFLHFSTDYVFDGSGARPWRPDDRPAPINIYGHTKLAGEQQIENAGGQSVILRTSWVFSAHGENFVKTMLRLGASRDDIRVVADQIGGPTAAADIAAASFEIVQTMASNRSIAGTYHFSGTPDLSWADFAREIFSLSGLTCDVRNITTDDYPTQARRPHNSRLDCSSLSGTFQIRQTDWPKSLTKVLRELGAIR